MFSAFRRSVNRPRYRWLVGPLLQLSWKKNRRWKINLRNLRTREISISISLDRLWYRAVYIGRVYLRSRHETNRCWWYRGVGQKRHRRELVSETDKSPVLAGSFLRSWVGSLQKSFRKNYLCESIHSPECERKHAFDAIGESCKLWTDLL